MTSAQSLRLYELPLKFVRDKDKAIEYVTKILEVVDAKVAERSDIFLTKDDKVDLIKWMVALTLSSIGILSSLVAFLFNYYLKK